VMILTAATCLYAAWGAADPVQNIVAAYSQFHHLRELCVLEIHAPDKTGWTPTLSPRWAYYAMVTPLVITLAIALTFCCPCDVFAHFSCPSFELTPANQRPYRPYSWLTEPFVWLPDARLGYVWCYPTAVVLSFILPEFLLFVAFMPALLPRTSPAAKPRDGTG